MEQILTTSQADTLAVDVRGSGPALIFIAGAGPFRAIDPTTTETAEQAAELGLTTIVYDRIGRGGSSGPAPITLDREISALEAIIEAVGGKAALCGHSSGCAIGLRAAVSGLPVTGLALWEAPFGGTPEETRAWAEEYIRLLESGDNAEAVAHYMKDMPPEFLAWLQSSPLWELFVANAESLRADAEALTWVESAPLAQVAGELTIPVTAMVGEATFAEMHPAADAISAAIPGAGKQVMPGAEHGWEPAPMAAELARLFGGSRIS